MGRGKAVRESGAPELRCDNGHSLAPGVDRESAKWCPQCGSPLIVDLVESSERTPTRDTPTPDTPTPDTPTPETPTPDTPTPDTQATDTQPKFDDAVFISYAHIDNQPAGPTKARWIDEFREHLTIRLAELFGDQVSVFQDEELRGNDEVRDALHERLAKVAALVSISSPRYIKSEFCQWELSEFAAIAEADETVVGSSKGRVFNAMKTPVPHEALPAPLSDLVGYEFFEKSEADSRVREYLRNAIEQERWKFYARVDDVAEDLAELLLALGYDADDSSLPNQSGVTVFLAETASDMVEHRDDLRRELERRGYRVIPEQALPLDIDELPAALTEALEQADCALHPFGSRYGPRPDGDDKSMPQLQFEAALRAAENGELLQLVWIPDHGLEPVAAQSDLLNLLESLEVGSNTEIIRGSMNLFKAHALDRMASMADTPSPEPVTDAHRVYLVHHRIDTEAAASVRSGLEGMGYIVDVPLFDGTEAEIREVHETSMVLCDAVMIFHGSASEHWLRMKQFDLVKARGWGRTEPFAANAVWLASSSSDTTHAPSEALILDATGDNPTEGLLDVFRTELAVTRGGSGVAHA